MTGVQAKVFSSADPTQFIDLLPFRTDLKGMEEVENVGAGSVQVHAEDPRILAHPETLDYNNVVKIEAEGKAVSAFIIQKKRDVHVSRGEFAGTLRQVSGDGLRGWFRSAVVHPYGGLKSDSPSDRTFSFATERGTWYNPDQWYAPLLVQKYNMDPNSDPFGTAPAQWPDVPEAWWIWGTNTSVSAAGWNYFRYEFTVPAGTSGKHSFFASGADEMYSYIDGAEMMQTADGEWSSVMRSDFTLDPGPHVVAVAVRSKGTRRAGLIAALFRDATLLTATGQSGWLVNPYPTRYPSASLGEIVLTLLNEAEDRGVWFPRWLTPTFTATADSYGNPWPDPLNWSFAVGTELTDVIQQLEETGCDLWINPETLELNLAIARGHDRSVQTSTVSPIELRVGKNLVKADHEGKAEIKNSLLTQTDEGWRLFGDATTDSIAKYGRQEGLLSTNLDGVTSQAVADRVFKRQALPWTSSTYELISVPGAVPFVDFEVGDWIMAPDITGAMARVRVLSLSVTEDEKTGAPTYAAEFGTIAEDAEAKYERWLKALTKTSLSGSIANSTGLQSYAPTPGQILESPEGPDTRVPVAPTGLTVTTDTYLDGTGFPRGIINASWVPVTQATNGTTLEITSYEMAVRRNITGAPWRLAQRTNTTSMQYSPVDVGDEVQVRVRAYGLYTAKPGEWSPAVTVVVKDDETPPPVPSKPSVASRLGAVSITWDGRTASNGTMPMDFDHLDVRVGTDIVGALRGSGGNDILVLTNQPYFSTISVTMRSVDHSGNVSDWSEATTTTVNAVKGPDLEANSVTTNALDAGAVTASKISAGAVDATKVALGVLQTNMLRNPSFEDPTSTGAPPSNQDAPFWNFGNYNGSAYVESFSTQLARSGRSRLAFSNTAGSQPTDGPYVSQTVPGIVAGASYRLAAYVRSTSGTAQFYIAVQWLNASGAVIGSQVNVTGLTNVEFGSGWTEIGGTVTAPTGAVSANYILSYQGMVGATSTSFALADDVTFVRTGVGSYTEMTPGGIRMWNSQGTQTVDINGESATIRSGTLIGVSIFGSTITAGGDIGSKIVLSTDGFIRFYQDGEDAGSIEAVRLDPTTRRIRVNGRLSAGSMYSDSFNIGINRWTAVGLDVNTINVNSAIVSMYTATGDANVRSAGNSSALARISSMRALKLDREPIPAMYEILDLPSYTWRDRLETEENPDNQVRHAGFVAEDLSALSVLSGANFEALLELDSDGRPIGIEYSRVSAYLLPIVRDLHERLLDLENQ